jgi:hypothetical protein
MDRTADAITATIARMQPAEGRRALEPWEQESIADVLDAAAAWAAGQLDLNTAAHTGVIEYRGHPSPRYSRFIAITTTPRTDPRWQALDRLVTKITNAAAVPTHQGLFDVTDLHQHDRARDYLRQKGEAA